MSIDGREGWAPTDFLSVEASQKNEDISPLKNASNGNGLTKFKSQSKHMNVIYIIAGRETKL